MRRFALLLLLLTAFGRAEPDLSGGVPLTAGKKWALVVGAGNYTKLPPLRFAQTDATSFAETLKTRLGFSKKTVRLLTGGGAAEDAPTSANLLAALSRTLADQSLDRGDLFIVYFAGHGIGTKSGDYLMPEDAAPTEAETKGLPVRKIVEKIVAAGLRNVLFIADACRAGDKNPFGQDLIQLGRKANIGLLLGCAPGQVSYEDELLNHGVFTHYLLKAVNQPDLADPTTGALFASAIGERVRKQVEFYTATDHPDQPQRPSVWADKTQDPLVAIYPPKGGGSTLTAFSGSDDRPRLIRYLSGLGSDLPLDPTGNLKGVAGLKALDGLGETSQKDLFYLISRLHSLGRDAEVGPVARQLLAQKREGTYYDTALLLASSEDIGRLPRMEALFRIADDPDLAEIAPTFVDVFLEKRLNGSAAERIAALTRFASLPTNTGRSQAWILARKDQLEGRNTEARAGADSGLKLPGSYPDRQDFEVIRYDALQELGRREEASALADRMVSEGHGAFWLRRSLDAAVANNAPDRDARLQAAAAAAESPHSFVEILMASGDGARNLLPEAKQLCERFPYSWEARGAIWLCEALTDLKKIPRDLNHDDLKYAPTPLTLMAYTFGKYDVLLQNAVSAGRISGYVAPLMRDYAALQMLKQPDLFSNASALQAFLRLVEGSPHAFETSIRLDALSEKVLASNDDLSEFARATAIYLYLSAGRLPEALKVYGTMQKKGNRNPLATYRLGVGLALAGRGAEALEILAKGETTGDSAVPMQIARMFALTVVAKGDPSRASEAEKAYAALNDKTNEGEILFQLARHRLHPDGMIAGAFMEIVKSPPRGRLDIVAAALGAMDETLSRVPGDVPNNNRNAIAAFAAGYLGRSSTAFGLERRARRHANPISRAPTTSPVT